MFLLLSQWTLGAGLDERDRDKIGSPAESALVYVCCAQSGQGEGRV